MSSDLLTKISGEVEQRLAQLRPLVSEYERLLAASESLGQMQSSEPQRQAPVTATRRSAPKRRVPRRRGSAAGAVKRAASRRSAPRRAAVSVVGQAVLDALEHGSHTVSELVTVTAMRAGEIRGNIRRLLGDGKIAKVSRDGKTAYALPAAGDGSNS